MPISRKEIFESLGSISLLSAPEEFIEGLKQLSDTDLLRASNTSDMMAVVESNRRLKNAMQSEERAIKWLTWVLVALTAMLVILTGVLVLHP